MLSRQVEASIDDHLLVINDRLKASCGVLIEIALCVQLFSCLVRSDEGFNHTVRLNRLLVAVKDVLAAHIHGTDSLRMEKRRWSLRAASEDAFPRCLEILVCCSGLVACVP